MRRAAREGMARSWLVGLAALCLSGNVAAHIQKGEAVGFLTGLRHPISGLDHVLAMVSVGLWGAQMGAPAMWVLPVAFPMVMALGELIGLLESLCPEPNMALRPQ